MKQLFIALTGVIMLTSFTNNTGIDDIVTALKGGNASQVSKFFDKTVDITLPEKSNSYSRSQAEMILKDFFSINPIKGFQVIHKGENSGSHYCIGTLLTKNNVYRTTIFMKQKGEKQILQEIRFEDQ